MCFFKFVDGGKKCAVLGGIVVAALAISAHPATASVISVNCAGNPSYTLGPTVFAGVVPADNWNNADVSNRNWGSSTIPYALQDNTGSPSGATAYANFAAKSGSAGDTGTGGDGIMMDGGDLLNSSSGSQIYVNSLSSAYTGPTYDVYLYFSQSSGLSAQSDAFAFTPSGSSTVMAYGKSTTFNGTYIEAGGTSTANATAGNYIEFTGLSASGFEIAVTSSDVINGMQIVAETPEPASAGLLAFSGVALLRRRRFSRLRGK